ncbi:MAG TPA: FAD:protein FMN transferase [Cyclobacteriaceae bacterium]|nr:FAD:protein FMN transferase [Cyclobacteriaceae bacterium]
MGSAFEFVLVANADEGETLLDECVDEVRRIEFLLTEFSDTSQTFLINQSAGKKAVRVDDEVYSLLSRCKEISRLTQGAFDITSGALKKLYNFKGESFTMPTDEVIRETLSKVDFNKIQLSENHEVLLASPGMHISFAAIGKGYAADKVKNLMITKGIENGVINASGDLTAWGNREDGSPWKIGIADPLVPSSILLWIPIMNSSVATSGDYERYFELNGERYSHSINPKTGKPVKGIKSVTIVSPSAELSDALATAVFTMGVEVGLDFIEQLPHTHAIVVDERNNIGMTSHLKLSKYEGVR